MADAPLTARSVTCTGVVVRFGDTTALAGVSLSVRPGELVAVTGHSGAGKTTLLSVLAGVTRPDEGEVLVGTDPVDGLEGAVAAGVALVPQGNGLAAVLTAHENVLLPLLARHANPGGLPDGPPQPWRPSGWPRCTSTSSRSSRAVSSSGSPWPAGSRSRAPCCSPTSRPPSSTTPTERWCWPCCGPVPARAPQSS